MRLVVLGSGSSVPDGKRNGPGFLVEDEGLVLLLDCGAGALPSLARHAADWTALTHVFLGHFHIDHIVELPALLFALKHAPAARDRTGPLTVVGPAGTADLVRRWEKAVDDPFTDLHFDVGIEDIGPSTPFLIPGGTLRVIPTPHSDESLAVRVEVRGSSLGYTGDTGPSPDLAAFFMGCDVLVADCSLPEPREGAGHLSTVETARLAVDARVSHLVATHLFPEQDPGKVGRKLSSSFGGRVSVAHDGLEIEL